MHTLKLECLPVKCHKQHCKSTEVTAFCQSSDLWSTTLCLESSGRFRRGGAMEACPPHQKKTKFLTLKVQYNISTSATSTFVGNPRFSLPLKSNCWIHPCWQAPIPLMTLSLSLSPLMGLLKLAWNFSSANAYELWTDLWVQMSCVTDKVPETKNP